MRLINMWKSCNKWSEKQQKENLKVTNKLNQLQRKKEEKERKENITKSFPNNENKSEADTKNIKKINCVN